MFESICKNKYWRLLQPEASIILLLYILVGGYLANSNLLLGNFLMVSLPVIFVSFLASLLDTIGDKKSDKELAKKTGKESDNPLASGEIKGNRYLLFAPFLTLLFFISAYYMWNNILLVIVLFLTYFFVSLIYSFNPRISDMSILGNITFMLFLVYVPIILGSYLAMGEVPMLMPIIAFPIFLIMLIVDITKDVSYIDKDILTSRNSIVKKFGSIAMRFVASFLFLLVFLSLLLYFFIDLHYIYLFIVLLSFGILLPYFYEIRILSLRLKNLDVTEDFVENNSTFIKPVKNLYKKSIFLGGFVYPLALILGLTL